MTDEGTNKAHLVGGTIEVRHNGPDLRLIVTMNEILPPAIAAVCADSKVAEELADELTANLAVKIRDAIRDSFESLSASFKSSPQYAQWIAECGIIDESKIN